MTMRRAFGLSLLLCALSPAFSTEPSAPAGRPTELERLEQVFERARDAKQQGRLTPERYDEFLIQFRLSLEKAWSLSPRTPPETSAYARILARLGDSGQALAVLAPAMKQDPGDADLGLTFGEVAFERKDFPAALAQADAVLARDPGNRRALALKRLSEGRSSGAAASGPSPLDLSSDESASALDDPRIVEAGRRAAARRNALHFLDQSMRRIEIDDPREALRYLTLAEASDPGLADIPMQQGFAYMGLKEPAKAQPRFAQAEEMWSAKGDRQAALARTMRERAAAQVAERPQKVHQQPEPGEDPQRKTWPLGGAAAGFLLAGLGASLLKRDEDDRWRKPILAGAFIVVGVAGGGMLGYAAYAMATSAATTGAGGAMALVGGGSIGVAAVGEGGAVAATALGALAGGAAGAKAAENVSEIQPERREPLPGGAPGQGSTPGPVLFPVPVGSQGRPNDCSLKPGEDVLDRFIDGTRLAPGFLRRHEGVAGGHTIARHVKNRHDDRDLQYMRSRLAPEGEDREAASAFYDEPAAERAIRENIRANMEQISGWLLGTEKRIAYPFHPGDGIRPVGFGIRRGEADFTERYGSRARLLREPGCRIAINSAWPE